ncbi:MAG: AAA family ATPase [Myxococcota bacterium]
MTADRLEILVVSGDPSLVDEVRQAAAATDDVHASIRSAEGPREAVSTVRRRPVDLVCIEFGLDPKPIRDLATELRTIAPNVMLLGLHPPDLEHADSPVLIEALRLRFVDVLRRPISGTELRTILRDLEEASARLRGNQGLLVAFHSTKGGVGKSTLAINSACALARERPGRVLLVDASLQLGVCAPALDLDPEAGLADAARECARLDPSLLRGLTARHESGLQVLAAPRDAVDAADVDEAALSRVLAIARQSFEVVVVDTLPMVDDLMIAVLDQADRIFLVNQATVPDVIGASRLLDVLRRLEIDAERWRVVVNRTMPRFSGALTAEEIESRLGMPVAYEIPFDRRVLSGLNLGEPYVLRARTWSGWGRAVAELVSDVEGAVAERHGASRTAS